MQKSCLFGVLLIVAGPRALAKPTSLDHHSRWVLSALLAETLHHELASLETPGATLRQQVAFMQLVAGKIGYEPSLSKITSVDHTSKSQMRTAMSQLDHWDQWQFIEDAPNKLRPLCHTSARSLTCRSFRALSVATKDQVQMIKALHQVARYKPQEYGDDAVKGYHALLLLRQRQYPEVLRILFDLQKKDDKFKMIYNKVQRTYSLTQKASGDVVLRQTL